MDKQTRINLYNNLRRPEVDNLFSKKNKCLEEANFYNNKLSLNGENEDNKLYYLKRLQELKEQAEEYDRSARELWADIKKQAQKQ